MFMSMPGIVQSHIMGITLKGSTVGTYLYLSESFPAHQRLGKFKGAVLDQFGIQAAISPKVDILEKQTVHGRLYLRSRFLHIDYQVIGRLNPHFAALPVNDRPVSLLCGYTGVYTRQKDDQKIFSHRIETIYYPLDFSHTILVSIPLFGFHIQHSGC
ncbi:hypothetical protein SDC9_190166 [bioreactor metagenome]|uniref:Uncharacterized protein n=1 Tax=bioreactor metagenome TaxID=1076179 RepID=A0A645HWP5_9ZZZZ